MATARQSAGNVDILGMKPGSDPVVSLYLKLEPRDRTRQKYLTKVRNRVRELEYALPSMGWDRQAQAAIRDDLDRVVDYLRDEQRLPDAQGVAIFASRRLGLFDVHPLPRVHRSRLAVDRTPLVRELAASQAEVGRIFTVTLDRTTALIWETTVDGSRVVEKVASDVTRGGRYHAAGARSDSSREHTYNNRIRDEKRRHLEAVARALFELDRRSPGHQIVIAAPGAEASALEPFLHTYLSDRLIGLARMSPKDATPDTVHRLTMDVHAHYARLAESRHVAELQESHGTGWAVNGVHDTLDALAQGKVRMLLVRGDAVLPGFRSLRTGRLSTLARDLRDDGDVRPTVDIIDDAVEEALRQHVALDVIYDADLAEQVDGLAGLLRFK